MKTFLLAVVRFVIAVVLKFSNRLFPGMADALWAGVCPGMASVLLSDAIIPAVYMSYTAIDNPELTAFFQSGVAVRNALLDNAFSGGGTTVHVPFWKDLDPTVEPNYSTDNPADVATPNKIVAGEMLARVANMNQGYSAADLVAELAGSNPMQRIRNRFGTYWTRQWQRRLIATVQGVLAKNILTYASDMVQSVALETTVGVTAANLFSRANFTAAAFTMGDHFEAIMAIAVHSVVYKRMVDNDDITFERPSTVDPNIPISAGGNVPYFLGKRVVVDDTLPVIAGTTSGFKYTSVLFGEGVIGYGENNPLVAGEVYRRPDQGNGGGVEQIWERKSMIIQPFGHKFVSGSVAGQSPTLAELKLSANWDRVIERKNVPMAFLITNG